jgi:hypothetical protein
MKHIYILVLICLSVSTGFSQQANLPFTHSSYAQFERGLYLPGSGFHTDIKPFRKAEVLKALGTGVWDSLQRSYYSNPDKNRKWLMRKLRQENLIQAKGEDYSLQADFILEFGPGRNNVSGENLFLNTRGIQATGDLGSKFSFYTAYMETQASFPLYIDSFVKYNRVVPGQGMVRPFKGESYDFAVAMGYISFTPNKIFNIQFGHDRNFIGDGYRSLLLSDNHFPYPQLKIQSTFGPFKYLNIYGSLMDMRPGAQRDQGFPKKYVNIHYLSTRIGKRITAGLFESITWGGINRNLDLNYLNPIILYHPIAFADQSAANIMLGLNLKYTPVKDLILYGQLMLDEFRIKDVRDRNGWWGNKQGVQLGVKYYHVAGIKNLMIQSEYNTVRPYTYQYYATPGSYEHYNQALAHPVGANFKESMNFLRYRYRSWTAEVQFQFLVYGDDAPNINNGRRTNNSNITNRWKEYGIRTTDGILNVITNVGGRVQYLVNPKSMIALEGGVMSRKQEVQQRDIFNTLWIYAGIRTVLFNRYYDW